MTEVAIKAGAAAHNGNVTVDRNKIEIVSGLSVGERLAISGVMEI